VREDIAGVVVTSQTLKRAPNARDSCEEAKKPRVRAVAHRRLVPVTCVQAEEELEMAHGVRQRTEHVAEEEVAKFDWVDACKEQPPIAVQEPPPRSLIEVRCWKEECADGEPNENYWPVNVHCLATEAAEVKPHDESQVEGKDCGHLQRVSDTTSRRGIGGRLPRSAAASRAYAYYQTRRRTGN